MAKKAPSTFPSSKSLFLLYHIAQASRVKLPSTTPRLQRLFIMQLTLSALLSLLPLLAWGRECSPRLEKRATSATQAICKITWKEDVNCVRSPLGPERVVRTVEPGTILPVTCRLTGRSSDPYAQNLRKTIPKANLMLTA